MIERIGMKQRAELLSQMTKSKIKHFKTLTEKNENHTDPAPETPKKVENEPSEEEHEL
jgi:hypothetical protein